jgi:hypothetical protein
MHWQCEFESAQLVRGIHVHQGTTCDGDAGGHYYDKENVSTDPWASIAYSGIDAVEGTTDPVDTGLPSSDLVGRALIIHGYNGGRIACALLTAPAPTPTPTPAAVAVDWKIPMDPQTMSVAAGTIVTFTWNGVVHDVFEMSDATSFESCDFGHNPPPLAIRPR